MSSFHKRGKGGPEMGMAGARFHSELVAALEFGNHATGPEVLHCVTAVV